MIVPRSFIISLVITGIALTYGLLQLALEGFGVIDLPDRLLMAPTIFGMAMIFVTLVIYYKAATKHIEGDQRPPESN